MQSYDKINENIDQLLQSIPPTHVSDYDWLVQNIHHVTELEYQSKYKKYWVLNGAALSKEFIKKYFEQLQSGLNNNIPQLDILVNQLYKIPMRQDTYKIQFSFCTKLCHMLNNNLPIYDSNIKRFYKFVPPGTDLPVQQRISRLIEFHQFLVNEYNRVLDNGLLTMPIQKFRQRFNPQCFTDIKVIDSLIWAYSSIESNDKRERKNILKRKLEEILVS